MTTWGLGLHLSTDVTVDAVRYWVSTVELPFYTDGLDRFRYETMVFRYQPDGRVDYGGCYTERYNDRADAEAGHQLIVDQLHDGVLEMYEKVITADGDE